MINNQISSYGEKITQIQAIFILNNWDYDKLFMYKKVHFVAGLPLSGCVVLDWEVEICEMPALSTACAAIDFNELIASFTEFT